MERKVLDLWYLENRRKETCVVVNHAVLVVLVSRGRSHCVPVRFGNISTLFYDSGLHCKIV
jgi:hypothetical protein